MIIKLSKNRERGMIIPPAIKGKVKDAISLVLALNSAKLMPEFMLFYCPTI